MGKSSFQKIKKYLLPLNILIIVVLFCAYHYVDTEIDKQKLIEGVINSNCCGGIEAGVHYKETDRKPPEFVRRCFRSRRDGTEFVYEWNTMPCSTADSAECCKNSDGTDLGQCIPSTGGGYCKGTDRETMFRRGESTATSYIKRSNDKLLDINNTVDMEDYFFDRSATKMEKVLSPDMLEFLKRRDVNNKFLQAHILEKNRARIKQLQEAKMKAQEEKKLIQIKDTILAVHLIFVLGFALLIKDLIVKDIDGYYSLISDKYAEFMGKTVKNAGNKLPDAPAVPPPAPAAPPSPAAPAADGSPLDKLKDIF